MKLTLEINKALAPANDTFKVGSGVVMMTPPIGEDFWLFRVKVSEKQAILGFPKFTTIGIGFAIEDDWNTNLPYSCGTEEIYDHIQHNKGDTKISDETCLKAIKMVKDAAKQLKENGMNKPQNN